MKFWTAHLHQDAAPVLIPERFSPTAALFGPFWLLAHGAWIPALLSLAAILLAGALVPMPYLLLLEPAHALVLGLFGHDLRRWTMERRGYFLGHVVAARTEAEALGRLLSQRPHLMERFLPKGAA